MSHKAIRKFGESVPMHAALLDRWYGVAKRATWVSFAEAKESFNAADSVAPFVIIDIGGNKFRLIAEINFIRRVLFIRRIMTHKEYTKGAWRT